jgi:DNA-binding MarR family transcriptional regulator
MTSTARDSRAAEDRPDVDLVHLLRTVTVELDLLASAFARRNGLHPTDLRAVIALLDLDRAGAASTPGRLATALALDPSSVTTVVERLVRRGMVRRRPDEQDRRRVLLEVTEQAKDLGWSFFGPLIRDAAATAEALAEEGRSAVREFLGSVLRSIEGARSASGG